MKQLSFFIIFIGYTTLLKAQNVGIGTTTPTYPLTVQSTGASGKSITSKNGTLEVGFYNDGNSAYLQTWTASSLFFATNNGDAKISLINGTGYVGINTTTPSAQLDVNGALRLRGNGAAAGALLTSDASGNATWQIPMRSDVYTVGSADFKSDHGDKPVWVSGGIGGAYYTTAYYGNMIAPVHLPDGAKVNKIVVLFLDNDAGENMTFDFYGEITTTANAGSYYGFATLYSLGTASTSYRTVTQTFSTPIVIDNESYNYQFNAFVHWPGNGSTFAVKSVKFYYTY